MKHSVNNDGMLSLMINICTRVVTLIFIMISVFRKFFSQSGELYMGLKDIWGVLIIGIVSGFAFGIFFIKKNMTNRQFVLCEILYFLILNSVLVFIGLNLGWFQKELKSLAIMEIMFVLIYIIVTVLVYLLDFSEAKKINEKLQARKKNVE
ncbi:MAG: DUF3021 domain-containing protein [Treponema sp.]|nr:DUF3021 domain-containing protein [Treponema sp.]